MRGLQVHCQVVATLLPRGGGTMGYFCVCNTSYFHSQPFDLELQIWQDEQAIKSRLYMWFTLPFIHWEAPE